MQAASTNSITTRGKYKFNIGSVVNWKPYGNWIIKHRYTERFERNLNAIPRYVIWNESSNQLCTVSENTLVYANQPQIA